MRINDVAEGLAHLLSLLVVDEPVAVDRRGQLHAARHEHARPDDTVKPDDVLANQVNVARPRLAVGAIGPITPREVVRERIEPHVHNVRLGARELLVKGHRDAPAECGARDREVTQWLLQPVLDLIAPPLGHDEVLVGVDVGEELLLVLAHPEEVALLGHLLQGLARRRILIVSESSVVLRNKSLLTHIVPPLVRVQIDVPCLGCLDEELLGAFLVLVHGCADVKVVGDAHALVQILECLRILVADFNRLHTHALGRLSDLLPVLICPREKEDSTPIRTVPTRDHIGHARLVRVPHVGVPVCVVDCRSNVELLSRDIRGGGGGED
mmetsp:Transcript_52886/g.129139  ORF Transcript_52886/g.129139 Transcript_52886/m.129139 type:complete len:325 (+) Transcript_52886:1186-2160(+)